MFNFHYEIHFSLSCTNNPDTKLDNIQIIYKYKISKNVDNNEDEKTK